MFQDVRYAVRSLWRSPLFAAAAVITLALGIGANTAMITLLNATLFRPGPGSDPTRLVWLAPASGPSQRFRNLSYPEYREYRDVPNVFSGVVAFTRARMAIGGATPERVQGLIVSGNYFDVLGIRAAVGRTFRADEDTIPEGHPVAIIGDGLWRRRFGSDPAIVGTAVVVNGRPFTVVGVAPPGFSGIELDDEPAVIWVPLAMAGTMVPGSPGLLADRRAGWLRAVARLAPGATVAQAQAASGAIAGRFSAGPDDLPRSLTVMPVAGGFDPANRSELAPAFALLALVPMLVLVVACANAANLLLARGAPRRRELAVRGALGASRLRLVRQLLTESTLLALAAGAVGVLLSFWMIDAIGAIGEIPEGLASALTPDVRVLAATTLVATITGIAFGLAPSLAATRPALVPALKDEGISFRIGRRRHRLRDGLVVGQVAISLLLLVTAGLFLRSLGKALSVDPGFDPRGLLTMSVDPGLQGYSAAAQASFEDRLLDAVRAVPGVRTAAAISDVPLAGRMIGDAIAAEGAADDDEILIHYAGTSPRYFATMGIPLVRGRDFTAADGPGSAPVVIVNETLARRLWPDADPIGRRLRLTGRVPLREVVGVARDGKYDSLTDGRRPFVYFPDHQFQVSSQLSVVARVEGDAARTVRPLTAAVHAIDPNLPVFAVSSVEQLLAGNIDKQRAASAVLGAFGALAFVLAGLGVFGVTMHRVSARTREIGIRMSLGARAQDILALVIGEGLRVSLVGVAVGLLISLLVSRLLSGLLFGLGAIDAVAFAGGAALLVAMSIAACYLPARQAARVDPMVALRQE